MIRKNHYDKIKHKLWWCFFRNDQALYRTRKYSSLAIDCALHPRPEGRGFTARSINKNIDSINDAFIDTLLDVLLLKPVHALKHTFQPNDLPPTHLYALILFYRENDKSINSGVTTPITEIIEIFNSLRQSLLSQTSTQSLDLFQSFLEEKDYAPGYTFKDYAQTHKLNDVDYNEQLLEIFASAEKI